MHGIVFGASIDYCLAKKKKNAETCLNMDKDGHWVPVQLARNRTLRLQLSSRAPLCCCRMIVRGTGVCISDC